jgi:glyceraldehyde-3-phosphate dehydrogenase/erythrose-4-phosphate dehydrogenase
MTRVAINGFGRTGRSFLRAWLEMSAGFEIVAVNDIGELAQGANHACPVVIVHASAKVAA